MNFKTNQQKILKNDKKLQKKINFHKNITKLSQLNSNMYIGG